MTYFLITAKTYIVWIVHLDSDFVQNTLSENEAPVANKKEMSAIYALVVYDASGSLFAGRSMRPNRQYSVTDFTKAPNMKILLKK